MKKYSTEKGRRKRNARMKQHQRKHIAKYLFIFAWDHISINIITRSTKIN